MAPPKTARVNVREAPAAETTEVRATDTPTQVLTKDALKEVTVTDALGRVIVFGKPPILQQSRIVRAVGAEVAQNQAYMVQFVIPASWAKTIDGDPMKQPASLLEIEANIQRLGEEGIAAILDKIQEFGLAFQGEEEAKAAVKK